MPYTRQYTLPNAGAVWVLCGSVVSLANAPSHVLQGISRANSSRLIGTSNVQLEGA